MISPEHYRRLQEDAPDVVRIRVLSVGAHPVQRDAFGGEVLAVQLEARVEEVTRSAAGLQSGHVIDVRYESDRTLALGAEAVPIPVEGDVWTAFLRGDPDGTFHIAARHVSFHAVAPAADPAPSAEMWKHVARRLTGHAWPQLAAPAQIGRVETERPGYKGERLAILIGVGNAWGYERVLLLGLRVRPGATLAMFEPDVLLDPEDGVPPLYLALVRGASFAPLSSQETATIAASPEWDLVWFDRSPERQARFAELVEQVFGIQLEPVAEPTNTEPARVEPGRVPEELSEATEAEEAPSCPHCGKPVTAAVGTTLGSAHEWSVVPWNASWDGRCSVCGYDFTSPVVAGFATLSLARGWSTSMPMPDGSISTPTLTIRVRRAAATAGSLPREAEIVFAREEIEALVRELSGARGPLLRQLDATRDTT
ncbi:MAG: hypothetical protein U0166_00485 [Acidobacteriota bacterium]